MKAGSSEGNFSHSRELIPYVPNSHICDCWPPQAQHFVLRACVISYWKNTARTCLALFRVCFLNWIYACVIKSKSCQVQWDLFPGEYCSFSLTPQSTCTSAFMVLHCKIWLKAKRTMHNLRWATMWKNPKKQGPKKTRYLSKLFVQIKEKCTWNFTKILSKIWPLPSNKVACKKNNDISS